MKPFLSIFILITTLFCIVFLKMEERRLGYAVFKLTREKKKLNEDLRLQQIKLAQQTKPQLMDKWAKQSLTLQKVKSEQIIYLSTEQEVVPTKASGVLN